MDTVLGYVEDEKFNTRQYYLYLVGKRVAGCVALESITTAFSLENEAKHLEASGEVNIICSDDAYSVSMGISQIWVDAAFRRQGIAERLLDGARSKFIFGMVLPKEKCAFSQPTKSGLMFAKAYLHPHRILVYKC